MSETRVVLESPGGVRRAIAALVVALVPILYNLPVSASTQYGAIWSALDAPWWADVIVDVSLTVSCAFMVLAGPLCAGLALV